MTQDLDFAYQLYYSHQHYIEHKLNHRRFKHNDIITLIEQLKNKNGLQITEAGKSVQGRSINLIKFGQGQIKIFLWSQMHGDESTATMAIFDILNFLTADDGYNEFRNFLFNNASVYFMPMVNPDGAELFQRRNSLEIDLNRDAAMLQAVESNVLRNTFEELKADFGFNLHDQDINYSAGHSFKTAAISFLAPPDNNDHSLTPVRTDAIKLIARLYKILSSIVPGHIARYPSEFEPRAFGDNFQKMGTSTVLIESGYWKNDTEKQYIRKLNFVALLSSFKSIIEQSYNEQSLQEYDEIPFNETDLKSVILRNVKYSLDGNEFKIDIGINRIEVNINNASDYYVKSSVDDLGDLSVFFGHEDYNLEGMEVFTGGTFPTVLNSVDELITFDFIKLYEQGYTNVILNNNKDFAEEYSRFPVNIITNSGNVPINSIKTGEPADFIIKKNKKLRYAMVNGFLIDVNNFHWEKKNGLIVK